ncbi:hypothetical protein [Streptomyces nondiastaticus]|uniref:Uncharacterized protein n=1 Tax=Streptomyces nondiastaticus TaxID=3154512 RepID=A0ABW6TX84_9ACTN
MALRFLGIWPSTPDDGSPTIWQEEETGDLIIQSWKADEATVRAAQKVGSIPGHSTDVPPHETVIRLPANMLQFMPQPEAATSARDGLAIEGRSQAINSEDDGGNSGT